MIDQLAIDNADKNIVYVDHDWPTPTPIRWEVIRHTEEGMGLTWAMVESGQMYSRGVETPEEAIEKYTAMSNYAMAKEALADIKADYYVQDGMVYFKVTVTNLSEVTLSNENNGFVHAFIKETGYKHPTNTSHNAARGVGMTRIESLAIDATGIYYVAFPHRDVNDWENVEAYAFVDYQTEPNGVYNQLNAAKATEVEPVEANITVSPAKTHILAPIGYETLRDVELTVTADEGVEWTVTANQPWVSIDIPEGKGETMVKLSFDKTLIHNGENSVTLYVKDNESDAFAFAQVSIWVEYDTGGWEKMIFPRIYFPVLNTK